MNFKSYSKMCNPIKNSKKKGTRGIGITQPNAPIINITQPIVFLINLFRNFMFQSYNNNAQIKTARLIVGQGGYGMSVMSGRFIAKEASLTVIPLSEKTSANSLK